MSQYINPPSPSMAQFQTLSDQIGKHSVSNPYTVNQSNATLNNGCYMNYVGNIVNAQIEVTVNSASSLLEVCTISQVAYMPSTTVYVTGFDEDSKVAAFARINSSGNVHIYSTTASHTYCFNVCYAR